MEPFRLEEVLRVLLIALLSAAVGVVGYLGYELLRAPNFNGGALLASIFFFFPAWPVASVLAFALGLLLHIALRRWRLPRAALLPLFAGTSAAATWLVFQRYGGDGSSFQFVGLGTSVAAWWLYCFGPRPLWRYRFDPTSDSDF